MTNPLLQSTSRAPMTDSRPPWWLSLLWRLPLLRRLGPLPSLEVLAAGGDLQRSASVAVAQRVLDRIHERVGPAPEGARGNFLSSLDAEALVDRLMRGEGSQASRIAPPPAPPRARNPTMSPTSMGNRAAGFVLRAMSGSMWSVPIVLHAGWILLLAVKLMLDPADGGALPPAFIHVMEWVGGGRGADGRLHVDERDVLRVVGWFVLGLGVLRALLGAGRARRGARLLLGACFLSGLVGSVGLHVAAGWPVTPDAPFDPGLPLLAVVLPGIAIALFSAIAIGLGRFADWLDPAATR